MMSLLCFPFFIASWFALPLFCKPHNWYCRVFLTSQLTFAAVWTIEKTLTKLGVI